MKESFSGNKTPWNVSLHLGLQCIASRMYEPVSFISRDNQFLIDTTTGCGSHLTVKCTLYTELYCKSLSNRDKLYQNSQQTSCKLHWSNIVYWMQQAHCIRMQIEKSLLSIQILSILIDGNWDIQECRKSTRDVMEKKTAIMEPRRGAWRTS